MGFKFNPLTGTLDIAGSGGGSGVVTSVNGRSGDVVLGADDIPVDDTTLEVSNDETVIQIKDKGITEDKLSDELNSKIDRKAEANQKFFGGGEISVEAGPLVVAKSVDSYDQASSFSPINGPAPVVGTVISPDKDCYIEAFAFKIRPQFSESGTCLLEIRELSAPNTPQNPPILTKSAPLDDIGEFEAVFTFDSPIQLLSTKSYVVSVRADIAMAVYYGAADPSYPTIGAEDYEEPYWNSQGILLGMKYELLESSSALSFDEDIQIARPGLSLEDNVIEAPVSPIALNDGELLYVIPNEDDQGSALTLTAATSETLPDNALVLAYRDGEDVIVDGVRLESGQKAKLSQSPNNFDEFRYLDVVVPEDDETLIQTFSTFVYSSAWLEYQLHTDSGNFKGGSIKIVTDATGGNAATLVKHIETSIESDITTDCDILVVLDSGEVKVSVDNANVSDEARISWFIRFTPNVA